MMKKNNYWALALSILIAQSAGLIGSLFTSQSVSTWYVDLIKPAFNPPSWVFGPVWLTLYTLMGIAAYLIWKKKKSKRALQLYGVQLVLNSLWSFLFFGAKTPGLAFGEILILLGFIIATTHSFWKLDKRAAYLMIPYIAWVSFASVLNFSLWQLN